MKTSLFLFLILETCMLYSQSLQMIVPTGHTNTVWTVAFSPDSQFVLTASEDNTAKIWDLKTGRELQSFIGHGRTVRFAKFSADGKYVITYGDDQTRRLWDLNGNILDTLKGISAMEYFEGTHGLKYTGRGSTRETVTIEDSTGRIFQTLQGYAVPVAVAEFSPDGQRILTKSTRKADNWQQYWDLNKGILMNYEGRPFNPPLRRDRLYPQSAREVVYSPDSNMTLRRQPSAVLFTNQNRAASRTLRLSTEPPFRGASCVAFSPDGKTILAGTTENEAILWDTSGRQLTTFKGHTLWLSSVAASPDNKFVVTSSLDNTIKLWDTTGTLLATLITLNSNDWVVTTPSGLFDASPGAMHLLYYVIDLEVYELEQLKERYYEPGLLPKVLGYSPGGTRRVDALGKNLAKPPKINKASIQDSKVHVQLTERSGGIGPVVLLLNDNIELDNNVNPENKTAFELDLSRFARYFVSDSINHLSLRAYNRDGWLKGPHYRIEYKFEEVGSKSITENKEPKRNPLEAKKDAKLESVGLYALIVGTSNYSGTGIKKLNYPDKDAFAFAEAVRTTSAPLFGDNVEIKVLTTSAEPWPRKDEIRKQLAEFAQKAGPEDILLVFFSGHGIAYPPESEKGQFYYLTVDITSDNLSIPDVRDNQAIAQDSLQYWFNQITAQKRILILDACNSGQAVANLGEGKALSSDARRALERMYDKSGMFVLAGSAADKKSYETSRFGHGLLTYSLLNNMPRVAAANNSYIDVGKLFNETQDDVKRLAEEIDKEQQPDMIGNGSIDIGMISGAPPYPIPQSIPVFIRANFVNEQIKDVAHLSRAINNYFDDLASQTEPFLAFWDVPEFDGDHYYLSGKYTLEGDKISGEAYLYRKDKKLDIFPFSGSLKELKKLAEQIYENVADKVE